MDMNEELLTTKELADFLRLNEKKVYQLVKGGDIPHVRIVGKWLFPKNHILRWIDERVEREKDIYIIGSDDILMERLVKQYSQDNSSESIAFFAPAGSLTGIKSLSQRKGQACCTHLLDVETGEYNLPFLRRILAPQKYVVVHLWWRQQGIIVKQDNPLGIKNLEDIVKKKARFVNRNQGSGTRQLLEYRMGDKGLTGKDIIGFEDEVKSHWEVALKVFLGEADAGLGIEYVSRLLPLNFIPLQEERFDLVVPKALWPTKSMEKFVAYLEPDSLLRLAGKLPGYNLKDTGKVIFSD